MSWAEKFFENLILKLAQQIENTFQRNDLKSKIQKIWNFQNKMIRPIGFRPKFLVAGDVKIVFMTTKNLDDIFV